jgi:hypothetical protein
MKVKDAIEVLDSNKTLLKHSESKDDYHTQLLINSIETVIRFIFMANRRNKCKNCDR